MRTLAKTATASSIRRAEAPIKDLAVYAYTIPTDFPESDGTLEWDSTTLVLVEVTAGGERGLGFTYAGTASARLIRDHTAPSLHAHPCCALSPAVHVEYFHDHARIEHALFDGALTPRDGELRPDLSRPGLGLDFKRAEAERFAVPF